MLNYKKLGLLTCAFLINFFAKAQGSAVTTAADSSGFMRSEGKIYVVMAVVITILVGLIIYIARLDRKISKLEKGENL